MEYDPRWPAVFDELRGRIEPALAGIGASVEHIGSTAVPRLAAKPIIDIDIVVSRTDLLAVVVERLAPLGYRHKGNRGVEGREAFDQPPGLPNHHLYAVVAGSKPHLDHVLLRDLLRRDPSRAAAYAAEKRRHAHLLESNRLEYVDAKAALIESLLARARADLGLACDDGEIHDGRRFRWRASVPDREIDTLVAAAFERPAQPGRWRRARPLSLGWVTAHESDGRLVGFVNVAWDGGYHAFLLDAAVAPDRRRQGVGCELVRVASDRARRVGCTWLHVDFEEPLAGFYVDACGFQRSAAGLIRLSDE